MLGALGGSPLSILHVAAWSGAGTGVALPFSPTQLNLAAAWDPSQNLVASGGNLVTLGGAYSTTRTLTAGANAPDVMTAYSPGGKDMLRIVATSSDIATFPQIVTATLCGAVIYHLGTTAEQTLFQNAATNVNGHVRINGGATALQLRLAGQNYVSLPFPFQLVAGRPYLISWEGTAGGTARAYVNGIPGTSVALGGTTFTLDRVGAGGTNTGSDMGPAFLSTTIWAADRHSALYSFLFTDWLTNVFYVDEAAGNDNNVPAWKSGSAWMTLSKAASWTGVRPGDRFLCKGDFATQRIEPVASGATGAHISFEANNPGGAMAKVHSGTSASGGWTGGAAGRGSRAWAYDPNGMWFIKPSGKVIELTKRDLETGDNSYQFVAGVLYVRVDEIVSFGASNDNFRIALQTETTFCNSDKNYIRLVGWDIRYRNNFAIQTFGQEFLFEAGFYGWNVNDGYGGSGGTTTINDTWIILNGRASEENSEGDGISHHGGGRVTANRCTLVHNKFGQFRNQQSVFAELNDSVLIGGRYGAILSFNNTAGVGEMNATGNVIIMTAKNQDKIAIQIGDGHPITSMMRLRKNTIFCEGAIAGSIAAAWHTGQGEANDNIFHGFDLAMQAENGRVVTGGSNLVSSCLAVKQGTQIAVATTVADAGFVNAAARNLHLAPGSPAIGTASDGGNRGASDIALNLLDQYMASVHAA